MANTGAAVLENATSLIRGLAPVLTGYGIATEEEVDVDAFTGRGRHGWGEPDLAVWQRSPSARLERAHQCAGEKRGVQTVDTQSQRGSGLCWTLGALLNCAG